MTGSFQASNSMRRGSLIFAIAWAIHSTDHARRGLGASPEGVVWAGTFVAILAAVAITLILVGHAIAPAIAAVSFASIAVGVAASHLLPGWGPLSDPLLVDSTTDSWSTVAVTTEIVAATWLALTAFGVLKANTFSLTSQWAGGQNQSALVGASVLTRLDPPK